MQTEHRILCLAARTELDPDAERELRRLLAGEPDWDRLAAQARLHEVHTLVASTLEDVAAEVPEPWATRARRRTHAVLVRNLELAGELLAVVAALQATRIDVIPVKGVVLAETLYGSLALRPAADIDVLVRPEDMAPARDVLHALGYAQSPAPSFIAAHHPFHDAQYYRALPTGRSCLELHSALWDSRFFRSDESLWERASAGTLRGAEVLLLSDEDTLVHLAIHRTRSRLRLRFLCDIAELVRRRRRALDWTVVVSLAERLRARTAVFSGLWLARDLLGAPVPAQALSSLGVGRAKRRLLERTCGAPALFRAATDGDLSQQPSLALRALEQDGAAHIGVALARTMARKVPKSVYERRRARLTS